MYEKEDEIRSNMKRKNQKQREREREREIERDKERGTNNKIEEQEYYISIEQFTLISL